MIRIYILIQIALLIFVNCLFSQQKDNKLVAKTSSFKKDKTKLLLDSIEGKFNVISGNADIDFAKLSKQKKDIINSYKMTQDGVGRSNEERNSYKEKLNINYRMFGMKLWVYYPNDNRRYEWFKNTVLWGGATSIHYWKDIEAGNRAYFARSRNYSEGYTADIDWESMNAWERAYPKMKEDYIRHFSDKKNSGRLYDSEDKNRFDVSELESFLKRSLNTTYRNKNGKLNMEKLERLIVQAADTSAIDNIIDGLPSSSLNYRTKRVLDNDFLSRYRLYGLTNNDLQNLITKFIQNKNNPGLKEWGLQRKALLNLRAMPFDFAGTAIDGMEIDLKKMKGRVVLVDIWSIWCSSCIARMPAIATMYHKYKDYGFEVISLCLNEDDKLPEVKKIEERIGAGWPILLIGGGSNKESQGYRIMNKYGFFGVPQLLMLDKEGKLVMLNDILRDGDFEPLLLTLLKNNREETDTVSPAYDSRP